MNTKHFKQAVLAFAAVVLCAALASSARADSVTISSLTAITGQPGDTLTVYGDLTNNTGGTVYFSSDTINLASAAGSANDDLIVNAIFGLGPEAIDPNTTLSGVDLFTIQLLGAPGTYSGNSFDLYGGTDANACLSGSDGCNDFLGTAGFAFTIAGSVPTNVPEPATLWLFGGGLLAAACFLRRRPAFSPKARGE